MSKEQISQTVFQRSLKCSVAEEGGRRVRDGGHMYTRGWFMWLYGKNHYNIVKQLASN